MKVYPDKKRNPGDNPLLPGPTRRPPLPPPPARHADAPREPELPARRRRRRRARHLRTPVRQPTAACALEKLSRRVAEPERHADAAAEVKHPRRRRAAAASREPVADVAHEAGEPEVPLRLPGVLRLQVRPEPPPSARQELLPASDLAEEQHPAPVALLERRHELEKHPAPVLRRP